MDVWLIAQARDSRRAEDWPAQSLWWSESWFCGTRYLQLAQAPAQRIQGHGHVHTSRWVSTPKTTPSVPLGPSTPTIARTCAAPSYARFHHYRPEGAENGRHCDGSCHRHALIRSRCSGRGRLRSDVPDRPTGHSQGTIGPADRWVRPIRGVARNHL
jgi:hypothetical protein